MNTDLDTKILRAMTELVNAAPMPPPLPQPPGDESSRARRPAVLGRAAAIILAVVVGTVIIVSRHHDPARIINSPSNDAPNTDLNTLTSTQTTEPSAATSTIGETTPTAAPAESSTTSPLGAGDPNAHSLGLTGALPNDLAVWGIEHVVARPTATITSQLFGAMTRDGTRVDHGILLRTSSTQESIDSRSQVIEVRGQTGADTSVDGLDVNVKWIENGHTLIATAHGLDKGAVIAMLDDLHWNSNPDLGFDPASIDLPAIASATELPSIARSLTWYELAPTDETFSDIASVSRFVVGRTTSYLGPDIVFAGVKQSNGFVVCDTCRPYSIVALAPNGEVALGPQHTAQGHPNDADRANDIALLDALAPLKDADIAALDRHVTDRLGTLPVISSIDIGNVTIEERGSDPLTITALCMVRETERTCNLINQQHFSYEPLPAAATALLNGQWYIAFTTSITDTTDVAVTAADGTTLTAQEATDSTRRWQLYLVPDDATSITVTAPNLFPQPTYGRPPADSASTNTPTITAPTDGGPTAGATTTTIDPILLRHYTVKAGDSLYVIARRYGVTIDAIVAANQWREGQIHLLHPGDQINLPPAP
ncbi:MAG: LysM domain [Acidimicrobiales bacterium]|nr:LysM domain [Acidimicrobiales bacterium]